MAEIKSCGQIALRARAKRKEAERLEAEAEASSDSDDRLEKTRQSKGLHKEAGELEKASRWFAYMDVLEMRGQNKGPQKKTLARIDFLKRVIQESGAGDRQRIANAAWADPERPKHFESYGAVYRFLGRDEF